MTTSVANLEAGWGCISDIFNGICKVCQEVQEDRSERIPASLCRNVHRKKNIDDGSKSISSPSTARKCPRFNFQFGTRETRSSSISSELIDSSSAEASLARHLTFFSADEGKNRVAYNSGSNVEGNNEESIV